VVFGLNFHQQTRLQMWLFMIICYIMMASNFLNILLTGLMGYFKFTVWGATHARFAIFTILVFILTETLVMFFFIATGKSIKQMIQDVIYGNKQSCL